ncbi:MAG: hypothetical protein N2513_05430 [Deltaproteobacteria bacterium]|nr:hypothetical protein [Deltaproteobacteria bacterium]
MKKKSGKIGCGCLFFLLLFFLVFLGIFFHPISLKFLSKQLVYGDKIYFSDVAFVPRFVEDLDGELYIAAFEELRKGNVKALWIEDYYVLGISVTQILKKMAKDRGLKENLITGIKLDGKDYEKREALLDHFMKIGIKKVILFVPEYSSRRYKALYGNSRERAPIFLINPVKMRIYNHERWWKENVSRELLFREYSALISIYLGKLKYQEILKIKD